MVSALFYPDLKKGNNKGKGVQRKKWFSKNRGRTLRLVTLPSRDDPNAQQQECIRTVLDLLTVVYALDKWTVHLLL